MKYGLAENGMLPRCASMHSLLPGSADAASQVEPLADLVTDHPDRAGLWRLLAVAVVSTGETVATRLPIEAGRAVAPQAAYILAIALPGESPPAVRDLLTSLAREPAWTEMLAGALTLAIGRGDGRTLLAGLDAAVGQPGNLDEASIATLIGLGLSGRASALLDEDTRTGLELPRISSGRARGASPA